MASPAPAKNNNSLYIKGCLGCIGIIALFFLFISGVGGYAFYLEETAFDDHSKEILIVPIIDDGPTTLRLEWNGPGYAKINMWVRGPELTDAKGAVTCGNRRAFDSTKRHYRSKNDGGRKHIWLRDIYKSAGSKPTNCVVSFKTLNGSGPFEIVVTVSQRPSDWASF